MQLGQTNRDVFKLDVAQLFYLTCKAKSDIKLNTEHLGQWWVNMYVLMKPFSHLDTEFLNPAS